jgi:thioredoxin reductase (NADPH)
VTRNSIEVDILVVGAGPVGLFAAYYAGMRDLSVAIIDSLPAPGGQVSAMYPEKVIYDVAGIPAVKGADLVAGLIDQANTANPEWLLDREAGDLVITSDGRKQITTNRGDTVTAKAVVICGGIGTFRPRRLPAGEEFLGRGLAYFARDKHDFVGSRVLVVGGGDSAVDWALMLEPIAAEVTLVHRRTEFRAHPHSLRQLSQSRVHVVTDAEVADLRGGARVEGAVLHVKGNDEKRTLPVDHVIAALGFVANLGPLLRWNLDITQNRHIPVTPTMATAAPGIYAAGDINDYEGKVRLIVVGFGEAATAVNNAAVYIDPNEPTFPGHSTDRDPILV